MQHVCTMYVQHSLFSRILNLRFKHADQTHTEALYMYIYETMYVYVTEQCVIWKTKSLRSRGMKMAEGGLESRWLRGLFFGSIYICVLCGGAGSLTGRGTRLHTHTYTYKQRSVACAEEAESTWSHRTKTGTETETGAESGVSAVSRGKPSTGATCRCLTSHLFELSRATRNGREKWKIWWKFEMELWTLRYPYKY